MRAQPIVVGVDGSEESKAALRWAIGEARLRNVPLSVVHAWFALPALDADAGSGVEIDTPADALLEEFVAETVGTPQDVKISVHAVQTDHGAAEALLREADGATLLVVGSRGAGAIRGALLGSVSQKCVQHAACPVVVFRGGAPAPEPPPTVAAAGVPPA